MSTFQGVLRLALIAAVVAAVAYLFVVFVIPWLPTIFVVGYFVIATFVALAGLGALLVAQSARNPAEAVLKSAERAQAHKTFSATLVYYGNRVGAVINVIATALIWPLAGPVGAYFAIRSKADMSDPRSVILQNALKLTEPLQSLAVLLLMGFWVLIAQLGWVGDRYVGIFVGTLLISVLLRLVAMTILSGGLPELLRRKTSQPYTAFLIIGALDAASLLFGFHYLRTSDLVSPLVGGMGELSHTASLLFNTSTLPQRIVSYLDGSRLHRDDVVIGVAGFINYVALLKNALNFSKFHKQDADFIWLAQIELQRGHPAVALRHLNQLSRDARNRGTALGVKAMCFLSLGEFDRAKTALAEGLKEEELGKINDDMLHSSIFGMSVVLPAGLKTRFDLFKWMASNNVAIGCSRTAQWALSPPCSRATRRRTGARSMRNSFNPWSLPTTGRCR